AWLTPTGDALKLVYRNPKGGAATGGGQDIVVDRVEFNATRNGTLSWEPGNTILGDAPAPGPGQILQRDGSCTDTNDPRDFSLAMEPGTSANERPTVAITVPSPGQQMPAATMVTLSWTMSDDVFLNAAMLIAVVLIVFVLFGYRRARKHEEASPSPPAQPPAAPLPVAPPVGAVLAGGDKKVCPGCHTAVKVEDVTCFFCGYKFTDENAPPP